MKERYANANFAKRLRIAMAASDISGSDLARHLGVSRMAVSHWMSGARAPCSSHLVELSKYLEFDLDWIFSPEAFSMRGRVKKPKLHDYSFEGREGAV